MDNVFVLAENKQAKEWLDSIPNLDEMYTCKTYEELEKIVNDWLNGESDDSSDSTSSLGTTRNFTDSSADSAAPSSDKTSENKKYKSLDDAFADLEDL